MEVIKEFEYVQILVFVEVLEFIFYEIEGWLYMYIGMEQLSKQMVDGGSYVVYCWSRELEKKQEVYIEYV